MGAEVVEVFEDEEAFAGAADLGEGGEHAAGEDVAVEPGVGVGFRLVGADGLEEAEAAGGELGGDQFSEGAVVAVADVFEEADGDDAVEGAGFVEGVAVVGEFEADGEIAAELAGIGDLLL